MKNQEINIRMTTEKMIKIQIQNQAIPSFFFKNSNISTFSDNINSVTLAICYVTSSTEQ